MKSKPIKKYPTVGCCCLDCGLCPRYYTQGSSRCPGCCGPNFFEKNPGCGYINCCVKKKSLEVCPECDEFPCSRFQSWSKNGTKYDSFLTYKQVYPNSIYIQDHGLKKFLEKQHIRIKLLEKMLEEYNDGRSKSFFCLATTLLPSSKIEESLKRSEEEIKNNNVKLNDKKDKSKILKKILNQSAENNGIELKLR